MTADSLRLTAYGPDEDGFGVVEGAGLMVTADSLRPGAKHPNTEHSSCGPRTGQAAFRAHAGPSGAGLRVAAIPAPVGATDSGAMGASPILRSGKALRGGSGTAHRFALPAVLGIMPTAPPPTCSGSPLPRGSGQPLGGPFPEPLRGPSPLRLPRPSPWRLCGASVEWLS